MKEKIAKEGVITFFGGVVGVVMRFSSEVIIARIVSISEFGLYGLFINLVSVFHTLLSAGPRSVIQRYIPILHNQGDWARIKKILIYAFLSIFILAPILITALLSQKEEVSGLVGNASLSEYILILAIAAPILSMIYLIADFFRATDKVKLFNVVQEIIPGVLYVLFIGVMYLFYSNSIFNIFIAYIASLLASLLFGLLLLKRYPLRINEVKVCNKPHSGILKHAFFSMLLYGLWIVKERVAIFIVSSEMTIEDVALYFVTLRFILSISLIRSALSSILMPRISKLYHSNDMETLQSTYALVTRWMAIVILPITIVISFYTNEIAAFLFGDEYGRISLYVFIVLFFQMLSLLTGSSSIFLQMIGKPMDEMLFQLASAIIIVIVCSVLTEEYGLVGASIGVFGIMWVIDVLKMLYIRHRIHINPIQLKYWIYMKLLIVFWAASYFVLVSFEQVQELKVLMLACVLVVVLSIQYIVMVDAIERKWVNNSLRELWKNFR